MKEVNLTEKWKQNGKIIEELIEHSGVDIRNCYQCGKCSAGCPMAFVMDVSPNRIIRMLQLGMWEEVLQSRTPWICALCATCYTRCPRDIDLPKLMDAVRVITYNKNMVDHVKNEKIFHSSFMKWLYRYGRIYELGLVLDLNLKTGNLFNDVELGPPMILKGRLDFLPPRIKNKDLIRRMAERARQIEGGQA